MRLQAKIISAAVPLALAAGLGTAVAAKKVVHAILTEQVGSRGLWKAKELRAAAMPGLQAADEDQLLPVLKAGLESGAVYAIALSTGGTVLAHTNVAEKGKTYDEPASARAPAAPVYREMTADGRAVLDVAMPVRTSHSDPVEEFILSGRKEDQGDVLLGVLRLGFPLDDALDTERRIFRNVLAAMGAIGVLALGMALFFLRRVLRPIHHLVVATEQLAKGNYGHQVPISSDEIGDLARRFNRMSQQLEETTVSKDFMERSVRERTLQLTEANGRLTQEMEEKSRAENQRRELEMQLLQSQKMEAIGQLAGGVAHDFNNLLTVIMGFARMVLNMTTKEDARREGLEQISLASNRAAALTRQLLAFSRKQVLKPRTLNLNDIFQEMDEILRRLIGEDIEFALDLAPDLKPVKADPGQLEQVLLNMVVNARDAMPKGGKILLSTRNDEVPAGIVWHGEPVAAGPYVRLDVNDTGCGMDAATKARIFEPFFTTKGEGKGTGLGLSMVYGIVRQSGGHIQVESQVGAGSTFRIFLPRAEKKEAPSAPEENPASAMAGSGTILLVEDEPSVRALTRSILSGAGYDILEAGNPQVALDISRNHAGRIDMLLTDVVMPKISGKDLAGLIARTRPDIKVLFVSGYTDDIIARHGVLEPGTAFLEKPFLPDVLLRKVKETLSRPSP